MTAAAAVLAAPATSEAIVLTEAEARECLAADMAAVDGVPVSWWGDGQGIVVATDDTAVAARVADAFCRAELACGYLAVAGGSVVVDGPFAAVLVRCLDGGDVGWVPACPDAAYGLMLCEVRPARPLHLAFTAGLLADIQFGDSDEDLTVALAAEDALEDTGQLRPDARRTCSTCRVWASAVHVGSDEHLRALMAAADRLLAVGNVPVDDGGLAAVLVAEDEAEDAGLLARADRRTCRVCGVWATDAHLADPRHMREPRDDDADGRVLTAVPVDPRWARRPDRAGGGSR